MALDAVTYSAVTQLKQPIGSALLVSNDFSSPNYIDSGTVINEVLYPKLAAITEGSFDGTTYTMTNVPSFTGSFGTTVTSGFLNLLSSNLGFFTDNVLQSVIRGLFTTDGGQTWTPLTLPNTVNYLSVTYQLNNMRITRYGNNFFIVGNIVAASTNIYILQTTDFVNWTTVRTTVTTVVASVNAIGSGLYINGTVHYTPNYGTNVFGPITATGTQLLTRGIPLSVNVTATSAPPNLVIIDGWHSRTPMSTSVPSFVGLLDSTQLSVASNTYVSGILVGNSYSNTLYVSTDNGNTFLSRTLPTACQTLGYAGSTIVAGDRVSSLLHCSYDNGSTWNTTTVTITGTWAVTATPGTNTCFISVTESNQTRLYLPSASVKKVPYIDPPSVGLKWVIRAK